MNNNNIEQVRSVLASLKAELQTRPYNMDKEVMRAVRNLGMSDFDAILEAHVPGYKDLEPNNEDAKNRAA